MERKAPHIGTLNEKPLHAALKTWYAEEGDAFEVPIDGFVADIVRGNLIIEIQTGAVSALRRKLSALIPRHPIRLVVPIPAEKVIRHQDADGIPSKMPRRSPKRGDILDVFLELVSIPRLLADPNFSVEVVLVRLDEVRRAAPGRRRRVPWTVHERRLVTVVDSFVLDHPGDYLAAIPPTVVEPFTTAEIAEAIGRPRRLAQKIAYSLREMDVLVAVGKRGNAILYRRNLAASAPATGDTL